MAKVKRFRSGGSSVAAAAPEDKEPSRQLKSKAKPFTRTLETADAGGKYPVKPNLPKVATAGGTNIIKRPSSELATRAGKLVFSGANAAKSGRLGRTAQIIAGALDPSELGDASLSNEASAQAVKKGAYVPDEVTSAKSRGANRESMYGSQKNTSDGTDIGNEPSNNIGNSTPKTLTKEVKKVSITPAKSSRNSMADEWAAFSKGREADTAALKDITDRYKQTGTLVKAEDSDLPKPSDLKDTDFKKGGMTKRPPKPAKKVPPRKFASGGSTSRTSASKRGDGCATKGHTKGKYL